MTRKRDRRSSSDKSANHADANGRDNNDGGPAGALTSDNLRRFTRETRREQARERGQSTPSPEPKFRSESNSTLSSRIKAHAPRRQSSTASQKARNKYIKEHSAEIWNRINGFAPQQTSSLVAAAGGTPQKGAVLGDERRDGEKPLDTVTAAAAKTTAAVASSSQPQNNRVEMRAPEQQAAAIGAGATSPPGPDQPAVNRRPVWVDGISRSRCHSPVRPSLKKSWFEKDSPFRGSGPGATQPQAAGAKFNTIGTDKPSKAAEPRFPPNFPTYRATQSLNEAGAFLANASYFISVGGPPLADIKYGIIAVPVGEEGVLFGRQPDHVESQGFLDAVADAKREFYRDVRMHDMDEDSDEFLRPRFDDYEPADPPIESFRGVEQMPPRLVGRETSEVASPDRKTRAGRGGKGGGKRGTSKAAAVAGAKPQGITKTRSSARTRAAAGATKATTRSAARKRA